MDSIQQVPAHNLQNDFECTYITAHQIAKEVGISRSSVLYAQKRGVLPAPHVTVPLGENGNALHLWVRSIINPILERWINVKQLQKELVSK
jgi:hypothetical protein